jgi:hypothetical protein
MLVLYHHARKRDKVERKYETYYYYWYQVSKETPQA